MERPLYFIQLGKLLAISTTFFIVLSKASTVEQNTAAPLIGKTAY